MEDILTSSVFGLLKYLAPELGLFRFLSRAKTLDGDSLLSVLGTIHESHCVSVTYEFWPRWPKNGTEAVSTCEPDVVLHIRLSHKVSYLIAIEAKYLSGKSSKAEEIEEPAVDRPSNDQLAREWICLVEEARFCDAQPVLVYLTANAVCPQEEILASLKDCPVKCDGSSLQPTICWLSWRHLPSLFQHDTNEILKDIAIIARRMDLIFFQGFSAVGIILSDWKYTSWRFSMDPIKCQWRFRR